MYISGLGLEDGSREEAVALEEVDGETAELESFRLRDMTGYQCNYDLLGDSGQSITLNAEEENEISSG